MSTRAEHSWWQAPTVPAGQYMLGRITLPGSKSLTARWMLLAATGHEPVELCGALESDDTRAMADALSAFGATISWAGERCRISPIPRDPSGQIQIPGNLTINAHQAGTVMRFVLPLAAMADGDILINCAHNARHRPIAGLVAAVRDLGVEISWENSANPRFPLTVHGRGPLDGGRITLDTRASSQFLSALLLAAPLMSHGLDVSLSHSTIPSTPHIGMTIAALQQAGHTVVVNKNSWHVKPGKPPTPSTTANAHRVKIEPDLSNAGPFLAAAMVTGTTITIDNWPQHSTQPGRAYLDLLRMAGGQLEVVTTPAGNELVCRGPHEIQPLDVDMSDVGELVPTIAAICAFASGQSTLRNIGHLRGHETDRLAALATALTRVGAHAHATSDALVIDANPRALHAADLDSYADHRMATCGAILGLRIAGVRVGNMDATTKTFPQFIHMWESMIKRTDEKG